MGGAPCCEGNVTPAAEYNIWVDPEAARIVMRSGLPVELIGWHLCRGEAVLTANDIAYVESLKSKLGHFAIECVMRERLTRPKPVKMESACQIRLRCALRWTLA